MRFWRRVEPSAWLLIGSSFFGSIPVAFLIVTLPIYLHRIGLHPELIGTLFTISGLATALLLVVFGMLADRYGRKPFVLVGSMLPVASYVILAMTTAKLPLLVASAVGGIGLSGGMSGALMIAGFNALLSEKSTTETRTWLFSVAEMAWVGAALIGSLLAGLPGFLQAQFGMSYRGAYHVAFLFMVALGVLSTLVLLPIHEDRSLRPRRTHWLPRVSGRRIALLSVTLGCLGLGLGFIVQLLPLWFHLRFGVSEGFLGPWYGTAQVLALGSLALAPPLTRRFGAVPFVVVSQSLASACLVVMAFAPAVSVAVGLWLCRTFVMNASWPVQQAYIMDVVDPAERASASSMTYAAWSVASALTPPIGGALLGVHLYTVPFLLGALCYVVAISFFYWRFHAVRVPIHVDIEYGHAASAD